MAANEDRVQILLNGLSEVLGCRQCGTRLRFGDMDCPHCGADLEDDLREWAERVLRSLDSGRD